MIRPHSTAARRAGPFWAVTSFYNPAGYRRRKINYGLFRQHLDLPLLTVEWSRDGRFELGPEDADILIQLDGGDVMWQKERLLNIGVARLPAQCTHVAWIDCDVVFENPAWPAQALERLEDGLLVQLFERVVHLMPTPIERLRHDASWRDAGVLGQRIGTARMYCDAKSSGDWSSFGMLTAGQLFATRCSNGHAWAAHRSLLQEYPLFDAWVVGSGDFAFAYAAAGLSDLVHQMSGLTGAHAAHYLKQARQLKRKIDGRIACAPGTLLHLWHGDPADRMYLERFAILARHGFDPDRDLDIDPLTGVWRWRHANQPLAAEVAGYFTSRFEDGRDASGA